MKVVGLVQRIRRAFGALEEQPHAAEQQLLLLGKLHAERVKAVGRIASLREVEFKVFSQFGDDGIIQWLTHHLDLPNHTFIEFGVENYREANTRFLLINDNWSGLVMDGSEGNVAQIIKSEYYWQHELTAKAHFIDRDNINGILAASPLGKDIGILHIDLDGNDYWIWKAIEAVTPAVFIVEYNSHYGLERAITIPYAPAFNRTAAHFSNMYYGASLRAFDHLSRQKGYSFVGCNSAGNNAYFVKTERLNDIVREVSLEKGFVMSKFRDSRDRDGKLSHLAGAERLEAIRGLPVFNVLAERTEVL